MRLKVKREIRKEARVLGLKVSNLYIFIALIVLGIMPVLNNITLIKFAGTLVFYAISYAVLLGLQNFDADEFYGNLPDELHN